MSNNYYLHPNSKHATIHISMDQTIFKTIYLATDHAGFAFKEIVKSHLKNTYEVVDCGAYELKEGDDYPDFIKIAAQKVSDAAEAGVRDAAIIFGGSGQGEAIVAGRLPHIRTTVCYGGPDALKIAVLGREHNDANVLSIGARFVEEKDLLHIVDAWITMPFSNEERHVRRLAEIEKK